MTVSRRQGLTAAAVIVLALFAIFVWPTRYRYDHLHRSGQTFPVRIDRFSGRADYFDGAWENDESPTRGTTMQTREQTREQTPDSAEFEAWKRAHRP